MNFVLIFFAILCNINGLLCTSIKSNLSFLIFFINKLQYSFVVLRNFELSDFRGILKQFSVKYNLELVFPNIMLFFLKLDFSSQNTIVPNFFQPFVQKNIKIEFSYKSKYDNFVIFRGDGDQDRPS